MFSVDQWRCITEGFASLSESRFILREMIDVSDAHNFGRTLNSLAVRIDAAVETFNSAAQLSSSPIVDGNETRLKEINRLCETVLIAIQNIYNKYAIDPETKSPTNPEVNPETDVEATDDFEKNHLTVMLLDEMKIDLENLLKVNSTSSTLSRLVSLCSQDSSNALLLGKCLPVIDQYVHVIEYYFSLQLATLRTSSKLLSVLLNIFNQLLEKGFCRPTELEEDSSAGSGTQFQENESGGLGEGDGGKDVSDQIENEDQLESAKQEGDEEEQEDQNGCKEEENGIEMSEDFKAQLQDKDDGDKSDNEDEDEDKEDEDNLDKEMGETGDQADQLDEKLWGSDEEEDDDDVDDADQEEGQGDGQKSESQMTAKEGDNEEGKENADSGDSQKKDEAKQPDDENDDENINDDHIDPYHSSHEPPPQPEPLDVPDDLNLDGGDPGRDEEEPDQAEENPFDIDAMQEQQVDEGEQDAEGEDKPEDTQAEEMTDPSDGPDANPQGENAKDQGDDEKESEKDEGEPSDQQMEESNENDSSQTADPEQAIPSMDQPSEAEAQPATEEAVKGSQDRTANKDQQTEKMPEEAGQNEEAANDETEGIGMAESRQTEGHDGQEQSKVNRQTLKKEEDEARGKGKPKKPGQSDPNRALADDRKERVLQVSTFLYLERYSNEIVDLFMHRWFDHMYSYSHTSVILFIVLDFIG